MSLFNFQSMTWQDITSSTVFKTNQRQIIKTRATHQHRVPLADWVTHFGPSNLETTALALVKHSKVLCDQVETETRPKLSPNYGPKSTKAADGIILRCKPSLQSLHAGIRKFRTGPGAVVGGNLNAAALSDWKYTEYAAEITFKAITLAGFHGEILDWEHDSVWAITSNNPQQNYWRYSTWKFVPTTGQPSCPIVDLFSKYKRYQCFGIAWKFA